MQSKNLSKVGLSRGRIINETTGSLLTGIARERKREFCVIHEDEQIPDSTFEGVQNHISTGDNPTKERWTFVTFVKLRY